MKHENMKICSFDPPQSPCRSSWASLCCVDSGFLVCRYIMALNRIQATQPGAKAGRVDSPKASPSSTRPLAESVRTHFCMTRLSSPPIILELTPWKHLHIGVVDFWHPHQRLTKNHDSRSAIIFRPEHRGVSHPPVSQLQSVTWVVSSLSSPSHRCW